MRALYDVIILGELVLVPTTLLLLVIALVAPSRRRYRAAVVLAVSLALLAMQPFGLTAHRQSRVPTGAHQVNATSVHVGRLFGAVPAMPFVLYSQDYPFFPGGENGNKTTLTAFSWLWLPVLTHATVVAKMCSNNGDLPCWEPHDQRGLYLYFRSGRYYAALTAPGTRRPSTLAVWEIQPGVASLPGVIYWALLAVLIPAVTARLRHHHVSPRRPHAGLR